MLRLFRTSIGDAPKLPGGEIKEEIHWIFQENKDLTWDLERQQNWED